MWSEKLKRDLEHRHHLYGDIMTIVRLASKEIIQSHGPSQTEAFYEKMLSLHLYERGIPFITQIDTFAQYNGAQVHVGRIDMEIAHNTILELKVGAKVRPQDEAQLAKYVRARQALGMRCENAAVVCFRDDGTIEIVFFKPPI